MNRCMHGHTNTENSLPIRDEEKKNRKLIIKWYRLVQKTNNRSSSISRAFLN